MATILDFPSALQEVRGVMTPGRLKLQDKGNIVFKNSKTGIVENLMPADILTAQWLQRARGYCVRFKVDNDHVYRYDGFEESDFEKLSLFLKSHYEIELEKKDLSTRGWNWGAAEFDGNSLNFNINGKTAFEVPLNNVSHSAISKNEVSLEFHQNDDAPISLMECRFHIPGDKDNADLDTVEDFHEKVMSKADIIQATGSAIVEVPEVQCLTPRGRYTIKMFPTFLQLHGKTYDYKISYTSIIRIFLLPHNDHIYFVLSLDPPIKQGQTRYHFVVMLFNKGDHMTLEFDMDKEEMEEKFAGKLQKEMNGPEYEVISRIMKTFVNRKITVPGNFSSVQGNNYISCSYKANNGYLYPLARGFIFVYKPPIHIRFDEISCVNFGRSTGSCTRSFDFEVETNSGSLFSFASIEKEEYSKLFDFVVTQKQLRVKNVSGKNSTNVYNDDMDESDGEEHDVYMEKIKNTRTDSESSTDEDYNLDDASSCSDVADEYDSNVATTDSEADPSEKGRSRGGPNNASDMSADEDYVAPDEAMHQDGEDDEGISKSKKKSGTSGASKKKKAVRKFAAGSDDDEEAGGETKTKKKGKGKKNRDPLMPKRPMTVYFLWLNENRERLKAMKPDESLMEFSKRAGEVWRSLDATDKKKYDDLSIKEKEKYAVAMEEYRANKGSSVPSQSPKKSPKKSVSKKSIGGSDSKETGGGSGVAGYKSKEFISSGDDDSD